MADSVYMATMQPKPDKTDAERLSERLLPIEDWELAPPRVRSALEAEGRRRGAAYDLTFGWCVIERTQDGPVVVLSERASA